MPFVGYQPSVLFTEGDEHRRRAGVITEALEGIDQFELARDCRRIADRLIADFAGSGRTELMSSYVHALPMRAVVQMCGMPVSGSDTQQLVDDLRISLDAGEGTIRWRPTAASATGCADWSRTSGRPPAPTSPPAW